MIKILTYRNSCQNKFSPSHPAASSHYQVDPEDVTSQEHETNTEQVLHTKNDKSNTTNFTQLYKNNNYTYIKTKLVC